jgi:ring-1,2-phenylacetyl-CoA epoxidase subunit PaaB
MAFVLAKEAFTRRFLCVSIYITDTRNVFVSPLTEDTQNAYDFIGDQFEKGTEQTRFAKVDMPRNKIRLRVCFLVVP